MNTLHWSGLEYEVEGAEATAFYAIDGNEIYVEMFGREGERFTAHLDDPGTVTMQVYENGKPVTPPLSANTDSLPDVEAVIARVLFQMAFLRG